MSITTTPYGFIPTQVSGCSLWLDAADSSTVTLSGSTATQWNDKSGNGRNSTSCSATYSIGINGLGCMTNPVISGPIANSGSSTVTIFVVASNNRTGNLYDNMLALNVSPITNYYASGSLFLARHGDITNPQVFYAFMNGFPNGDLSFSFNRPFNTPFIFNIFQSGTVGSTYGNGTSYGDVNTRGSTFNYTTYYIGTCTGGPAWIGNIGEIIIFNSNLSISQRQQIESYLSQKWGLTASLPGGHPGLTSTVYRSTYLKNSAVKRNIATMTPFFTAFSPRQIPACALWLDGADSSTISFSSGSNVSTWSDKSGNGRNATVYAGTPTYTTALGMTFNGSSSLQITYTASPILESMFVIIKFNSVSGQGDILSGTAAGQREYLMYVPYSPGTIYLGRHSTGPSGAINGGTVTTGSNYLLGYVFNGTGNTISFFQSGNTITSGTPQFTYSAGGTISVIGSYNGGGYLQGQIYEMIIYSTALSITERQQVESYLSQKWRLTSSLPSGHLHLTRPAGAPGLVKKINSFNLIATLLSSGFMSTVFNIATYSLANIANAVSAASNSVVYIYSVAVPTGAKGKNGILVIFFNLYSLTAFSAGQYFDYGIYVDGVSQLLGDATGTIRYSQTASGTFAMSSAGISLGTNGLGNGFPLIVPITFSADASVIQIGLKNSLSALSTVSSTGLGYLTNVLTSSGTSNTANFIPQNTFTTVGASTYTVPTNTSAGVPVGVFIYCWGSGGCAAGGIYAGGSGGFVSGFYQCSPGTALYVVVGAIGTTAPVSGGGGTANQGNASNLQAGGFSGVFINGAATQANCICLGGGGGGAQNVTNGGGGGGGYPAGGNGTGGTGGSQSVQGSPFSSAGGNGAPAGGALIGASTYGVGAGGGGYWGGGCGNGGGGGGGSSFIDRLTSGATYANGGTVLGSSTPSANVPGGSGNSFYQSGKGVGNGVQQTTGTGLVVIVPAVGTNPCQIGVSAKLYSG